MNTKYKTIQPYFNNDTKTLFLSTKESNNLVEKTVPHLSKEKRINFYITAITELDVEILKTLLTNTKLTDEEKEPLLAILPINHSNIIAYGNGNEGGSSIFSPMFQVNFGTSNTSHQDPRWRSYEQTYEYWDNNPFINMCPDKKMCYESALRKLGAEGVHGMDNDKLPFYTVIWCDTEKNPKKAHRL